MKHIITVDPGGTTGFGYAVLSDGLLGAAWFDQDNDSGRFLGWAWDELHTHEPSDVIVVCENYIITAETLRKSRQTDPLEIIGALRWMTDYLGAQLQLQKPADAKRLATDDRLKKMGWWNGTRNDHANDAARHLFLFGTKYRYINPVEVDQRAAG